MDIGVQAVVSKSDELITYFRAFIFFVKQIKVSL